LQVDPATAVGLTIPKIGMPMEDLSGDVRILAKAARALQAEEGVVSMGVGCTTHPLAWGGGRGCHGSWRLHFAVSPQLRKKLQLLCALSHDQPSHQHAHPLQVEKDTGNTSSETASTSAGGSSSRQITLLQLVVAAVCALCAAVAHL
jgi:hypothetical protein